MTVGDWSFILAESFHNRILAFPRLFKGNKGSEQVEAVVAVSFGPRRGLSAKVAI